jgi:hypothetical protein
MRTSKPFTLGIAVGVALLLSLAPNVIRAEPEQNAAFVYRGQLKQNDQLASGTYDLLFHLFAEADAATTLGGICIDDVIISKGLISVELDFGPDSLKTEERWLEIGLRRDDAGTTCSHKLETYTKLAPLEKVPTPARRK